MVSAPHKDRFPCGFPSESKRHLAQSPVLATRPNDHLPGAHREEGFFLSNELRFTGPELVFTFFLISQAGQRCSSEPVLRGYDSLCLVILVTLSECIQVASPSRTVILKSDLSIPCVVQTGQRMGYILHHRHHKINEAGTQSLFPIQVLSSGAETYI